MLLAFFTNSIINETKFFFNPAYPDLLLKPMDCGNALPVPTTPTIHDGKRNFRDQYKSKHTEQTTKQQGQIKIYARPKSSSLQ